MDITTEALRSCKDCGHQGSLDDFIKDTTGKFGHANLCLECKRIRGRECHKTLTPVQRKIRRIRNTKQKAVSRKANRESHNAYMRDWNAANPEKVRNSNYRRLYNISLDEYNEMLNEQNNKCAICFESVDVVGRLHIDHDHETGEVRGLLCAACNHGIGKFREEPEILERAIDYLKATTYLRKKR